VELNFCDISDWSKKVTESTGFQVVDHQLNFYGFCKSCRPLQRPQSAGR
jgi:Fe2+ or Zn2+ uptake regulation protein